MPEKFTITNERDRAVKLRLPLGGSLDLAKGAELTRFLRAEDAKALGNTAGISVAKVADPKPPARPEALRPEKPAPKLTKPPPRRAMKAEGDD